MTKFYLYKLHFISPLHISDEQDDYSISMKTIYSDTFYAALISCLSKIGYDVPADGNIKCHISNLFPYYQASVPDKEDTERQKGVYTDPVYFLPRPLRQTLPKLSDVGKAKIIKKVSWLDLSYFERVAKGEVLFEGDNNSDIESIQGEYLSKHKIKSDFIFSQVSARVTVSRTGEKDATPFYMDRISFAEQSGLYFLALGNTEILDRAMGVLQYEGLGTDRNVGNGFFTFKKETIELSLPSDSHYSMSLSTYIPENKEQITQMLDGELIAYNFVRRGGWITTPPYNFYRKNAVYAFMAGSVFCLSSTDANVKGGLVDLNPTLSGKQLMEHPVWRDGRAIFIPIKL